MPIARLAALALAVLALATPSQRAEASLFTCGAATLARVQGATACLFDTGFGNDSEAVVNRVPGTDPGYFGFKDWEQVGRLDSDRRSGSFDFGSFDTAGANQFMLVFKSGSRNQSPSLIAYLVGALSGTWNTPFTRDPFPNHPRDGRDVSHISYYVRSAALPEPQPELPTIPTSTPGGVPVPEPGTLALLGMGLVGLAAARRRRRA